MKMNLDQTKLVGLTMELEQKTLEYKELCKELDTLKSEKIKPNDVLFLDLADRFLKNHKEIKEIVSQLEKLNSNMQS